MASPRSHTPKYEFWKMGLVCGEFVARSSSIDPAPIAEVFVFVVYWFSFLLSG